jgi:hypothetical protein
MEPTQCSETSAFNTQTPGKYPEENLSSLMLIMDLFVFTRELSVASIRPIIEKIKHWSSV